MRVVPKRPSKQLSFFQSHLSRWSEAYAAIGLSEEDVDDIEAKLDVAKEAYRAQQQAYSAARSATLRFRTASRTLAQAGSNAIMKIRTTAATTDDPQVYSLAWLPKPRKASPIAAPGQPSQFSVELLPIGPLRLRWKCKHPHNAEGTMYEIWRTVDGGAKEFLAVTGEKGFIDKTIPAGATMAVYWVTAVRGRKRGEEASQIVKLGVVPGSIPAGMRMPRAA